MVQTSSSDLELNAFLVRVSDALRGLGDPRAVSDAACRLLAERLGAECRWRELGAGDGEPAEAESAEHDPRDGASLVAPITAAGAPRAELIVSQGEPRRWTLAEKALVEEVAARTWAEVERARAVTALEVELADARELQRISSSLVDGAGDALYLQLLDAARSLMRSDLASLQMLVPEKNQLFLLAHHGFHESSAEFWRWVSLENKSPCADAMRFGEAVIVSDVEASAELAESDDLEECRRSGIRAVQSTPLVSRGGRVVGVISAHWRKPHAPSERELRLLAVVARQTADLLERRLAEEALRESEQKYRTLFESVDEGVARLELLFDAAGEPLDMRWLEHNAAFARHTAFPSVIGKRASEIFPDFDRKLLVFYAGVARSGRGMRLDRYASQVDRWFSVFASPVAGQPAQVVVVFTNITERKRAEESLRRSEVRNRYLVRLGDALRPLRDPAAVKRAAVQVLGEQLGANRAFYSDYDDDALLVSEVYERDIRSLPLGRQPKRPAAQWMRDAFELGQNVVFTDLEQDPRFEPGHRAKLAALEIRAAVSVPLLKDGRVVAFLTVQSKTVRVWSDDEVGLVEETAERTWEAVERARAGAALRESERMARSLLAEANEVRAAAEAANRAKDDFLASLGHELRTPLSAALLWARSLRAGAVPPGEISRAIDAIVLSAESQAHLIDDLLDLSRLTAGKIELERSAVDVKQMIERAVATIEPLATAKNVSLAVSVEGPDGLVLLDERRTKQVLWNLLSNAVKFSAEAGKVAVSAWAAGGVLRIEVADDGQGIEPEFLPHVFDKFRQADMADTRRHRGLGIGLTIAKRLVELHEGEIFAESAGRGRGATFRVLLPWLEASTSESLTRTPAPQLDGLRALLVEDDAETRAAMTWSLESAGAEVIAFPDAAEVLTALDAGLDVDVIVSDLGLPNVSGLELIAQINRRFGERNQAMPPSCAVSAHAREIDRRAAIAAGFDIYLAKPVTPERLIETVADLRDIALDSAPD